MARSSRFHPRTVSEPLTREYPTIDDVIDPYTWGSTTYAHLIGWQDQFGKGFRVYDIRGIAPTITSFGNILILDNSRYSFHVDEVGKRELGGAAAGRSTPGGGGGSGGAARRHGPHANVAVAVGEAVGDAVGEAVGEPFVEAVGEAFGVAEARTRPVQ